MFRSTDEAAGYLAGIIDGEGHIRGVRSRAGRAIIVVNTDYAIIEATVAACRALGINCSVWERDRHGDERTPGRKHQWQVTIGKQADLRLLTERVTLRAPTKWADLLQAIAAYRPLPRYHEARRLYDDGSSVGEVAEALGVPWSTAQLWIKRTGPLRPPGRRAGSR